MKIAVITIEGGTNYGAILQCYAFLRNLEKLGHSVTVLRCLTGEYPKSEKIWEALMTINSRDILYILRNKLHERNNLVPPEEQEELNTVFEDFRLKYVNRTPLITDREVGDYANKHFDAIIVGSDQVWSGLFVHSCFNFIGWVPEFSGKKMSFSTCSRHENLRDIRRKNLLKQCLEQFDYISVRDTTTQNLIKNIVGQEVDIVPDPSELYDYKEFLYQDNIIKKPYILFYMIGGEIDGGHKEALKKIKEQFGDLMIVGVKTGNPSSRLYEIADFIPDNLTPEMWVNMVAKASVVYTDSFHAILFSMKFRRPFLAYYQDVVRSSRLIFLKNKYKTTNIVKSVEEIKPIVVIEDYAVDKNILKESLKKAGIVNEDNI